MCLRRHIADILTLRNTNNVVPSYLDDRFKAPVE